MRNIKKEESFMDEVAKLSPLKKITFMKKFAEVGTKTYNILCLQCRMKVMRSGGGFINYCKDCKAKMKPFQNELKKELRK